MTATDYHGRHRADAPSDTGVRGYHGRHRDDRTEESARAAWHRNATRSGCSDLYDAHGVAVVIVAPVVA